jgi:undecaprenyl-diphosphatase
VTYLQATVLGVVQGLTEFLPVSSSGHLLLLPRLLAWPDQGLGVDAALHVGSLAALLAFFRAEVGRMLGGLDRRLLAALLLGTIPAGLAGVLVEPLVATRLRSPAVVAAGLIGWGLVMGAVDRWAAGRERPVRDVAAVGVGRALFVGLAQALALVPGTSRSGTTITAGLLAGMDRVTAARFAFLLGIPITAAAGGRETLALLRAGGAAVPLGPLLAGMAAAFASGLLAVWLLVRFLERRSLLPFVVYRVTLGLVILWLVR